MDKTLFSRAEAAEFLGLSPATVKMHTLAGTLPCERFGLTPVYTRTALEAFRTGDRRRPGRPPRFPQAVEEEAATTPG